ncbi:ureidoglycolate lyase [Aliagarivorans taiwanensis]|uniref:ureidoglycolate lyase n=1 Tax=Aliagarivorans taiwanensis TaxID=561966 RepID=UPI0004126897|nr:ureidoglycolate lyase [Aliagarivorans taiwanensis]
MSSATSQGARRLKVRPLTQQAFAPFGQVIEARPGESFEINQGSTERYHNLAELEFSGSAARPIINIFRGQAYQDALLALMEYHPYGSQLFMPLNQRPYLVVVAPKGELNEDEICAFLAQGHQGVNYAAGVWHHPLLALEQTSDFLVVDRAGDEANCVEQSLSQFIQLDY